jgi:hypothetical protein
MTIRSTCGIDDRLVGILMLDLDHLARDACCLCRVGDGAKGLVGVVLHACFVLRRRILNHLRIGRQRMKWRQHRKRRDFGANPLGQSDAVLHGFCGEFRPVGWYQDGGIHRPHLILLMAGLPSGSRDSEMAEAARGPATPGAAFAAIIVTCAGNRVLRSKYLHDAARLRGC